MFRLLLAQAALLAVAFAGGWAAAASGAPAGWMSGAMIAVTAFAATGLARPFAAPLRDFVIVLAGVSMGSGASPHALSALTHYPVSLAMMTLAVGAMTGSSYAVLAKSPGFSRQTALFAAIPGALSYVFVAAQGTGADMPRVAVAQVFRIFVLMAIVPLMAGRLGAAAPLVVPHDPALMTLALVAASFAVGYGLVRLKLNGALLYAAIGVSVVVHGSGLALGRPDPAIQIAAQALVGAWVGTRFIGFDWHLLRGLILAASGAFLAALASAAAFAAATAALIKISFLQALVAFAPGGLEAMTMMAFALGLDPLFVGAHHLARFFLISLTLPLLAKAAVGSPGAPVGSRQSNGTRGISCPRPCRLRRSTATDCRLPPADLSLPLSPILQCATASGAAASKSLNAHRVVRRLSCLLVRAAACSICPGPTPRLWPRRRRCRPTR